MKIIIVGCGKVGTALTAQLSREDNLVTVIDTIVVRNVSNTYDVMGIVGNGASYQVLQEADIEHADLMIAVTKSDEMNLLCCVIAKQAADCHTIARVRNPMYREEREFIRKKLGLSICRCVSWPERFSTVCWSVPLNGTARFIYRTEIS